MKQIKTFESFDNIETIEKEINEWISKHQEFDAQSIKIIPAVHQNNEIRYIGEVIYNTELDKRFKHAHR